MRQWKFSILINLWLVLLISACGSKHEIDLSQEADINYNGKTGSPSTKPIKILSLDGGGIRGVMTASLLEGFEKETGKKISELFDIFAGTSTGGLIVLGLATPNSQHNGPLLSAEEIKNFYLTKGPEIFKKTSFFLPGPSYDTDSMEKVIKQLIGNARLKDLLIPTLITAFDIERRKGYSLESDVDRFKDLSLLDAARSTSAAPTYFAPKLIKLPEQNGAVADHYMIDGGIYKNNPAILAFRKAKNKFGQEGSKRGFILISIGTGTPKVKPAQLIPDKKLVNMAMNISVTEDEETLNDIFKALPNSKLIRIQTVLDNATHSGITKLDNINKSNLDELLKVADDLKKSKEYKLAIDILKNSL